MRIAHLSDLHILERKPRLGLDVRFVSFGRSLDADSRIAKFAAALERARTASTGADHLIVSGDLTETGTIEQYETFASVLSESGWSSDAVTLVPGNHDTYSSPDAWKRALEGPLRPWTRGAACEPGKAIEMDDATILPIDVACHQAFTRSAGELTGDAAIALQWRLSDAILAKKPIVLVQHHPPFAHKNPVWHWIDGLRGFERLLDLLVRHANACLLHGHLHKVVDRIVETGAKVFGTSAIVEAELGATRVRFFEVIRGELVPATS